MNIDRLKLDEFLKKHLSQGCPICGCIEMDVLKIGALPVFNENLVTVMVNISCRKCGYIMSFDAQKIGVLKNI